MNDDQLTAIARFLCRSDIRVGLGEGMDQVVHQMYWEFEGRAPNVIEAAAKAMYAEQKRIGMKVAEALSPWRV